MFIEHWQLSLSPPLNFDYCGVGIDPGQTNMGMAFVYQGLADIYQIKLPGKVPATERMMATAIAVNYVLSFRPYPKGRLLEFSRDQCQCVIEGAAFGAPDGQVPLAENRTTAAITAMQAHLPIAILPPSEIKIRIFGKGNLRARDFWPYLQIKDEVDKVLRDDAAAALSCALFGYVLKRQESVTAITGG